MGSCVAKAIVATECLGPLELEIFNPSDRISHFPGVHSLIVLLQAPKFLFKEKELGSQG